jgi:hypothetical protein
MNLAVLKEIAVEVAQAINNAKNRRGGTNRYLNNVKSGLLASSGDLSWRRPLE